MPEPIDGLEPELRGAVFGVVSDAESAIAELNRTARPELLPLARFLLRTESIASSKVEGLQMETRQLARAEASHDSGRSIGADAAGILANIDAMQLAIERAVGAAEISEADLLDIHRLLMARAPNAGTIAGKFREVQNWIGGNEYNPCGADFVPPPSEEVASLVADLCRFVNGETLPPLVQAAVAHAQFETIHPFEDGNGRTGRALVQVVLRRRGLAPDFVPPISVVLAREKDRYVQGLQRFREGSLGEWIETFASAAAQSAMLAARYISAVEVLQQRWREQVRGHSRPRADAAVWDLIKVLPAHPIITVPIGVAATRRSKPAVANAIAELEAAAVLGRLTESARNRSWEAGGLLGLIAELESGGWLAARTEGYTDDQGHLWTFYSRAKLEVGARAIIELATTDTIDVGDSMPTALPGLSEIVIHKVPSGHGTNFNLVIRVPTDEAHGERRHVLENAKRRGGLAGDP